MTPAELERASTWHVEIIETIIEGVQWRREGDEYHAVGHGGLSINTRKGCWYQHSTGKGGWSVVPLVALLKGYDSTAATEWVEVFLRAHPGTGSAIADEHDQEREIESSTLTQAIIARLVDPAGTPVEVYLRSRGITGPIPDFVHFLPAARCGEGAVAALLKSHERVVGVQVGYIDPNGRKTTVLPYRRRHMLEKAPDAIFEIPKTNDAVDILVDKLVVEGLEDLLSLAELRRAARLVGLPGIGALRHLPVKKGERVIVCRDGDEPGSGADKGLIAGVDHLLLEGANVRITQMPPGEDANSILQSGGTAALDTLVSTAEPAALSRDGEITRLSRLDLFDYDQERKKAAERLGIRVSTLDHEIERQRTRERPAEDEDTGGQGQVLYVQSVEAWSEPVDGAALLGEIAKALRQYLILETHQADAIALWSAFSHAFDAFLVAPKLVICSVQKRSGKTRTLETLQRLVERALFCSGIGPAALLRLIEQYRPCLLLDEVDAAMRGSPEAAEALRGIINSGFDRAGANFVKLVPIPGGGWEPRLFSTWCPQILAGIGSLPDTVADRSICIHMQRKRATEKVQRLRGRDGEDLRLLARKAARWAADHLLELGAADPETPPQLNDRAADAWAPLLAIADVAGGEWPERARQAAILIAAQDDAETVETMLLADIRAAFEARAKGAKSAAEKWLADRISSQDLVAYLVDLEDRPWGEIHKGKPITKNWVAAKLRPFRISPLTIQLGRGRGAPTAKGYFRRAFEDVFARYLSPLPQTPDDQTVRPSDAAETRGVLAAAGTSDADWSDVSETPENPSKTAESDDLALQNGENGIGDAENERSGSRANGDARLLPPDPSDFTARPSDAAETQGVQAASETSDQLASDVPKTLEIPSKAAKFDGLALQNGVNGIGGSQEGKVAPRPKGKRLTRRQRDIITYATTHPALSAKQIANQVGAPPAEVAALIGRA